MLSFKKYIKHLNIIILIIDYNFIILISEFNNLKISLFI